MPEDILYSSGSNIGTFADNAAPGAPSGYSGGSPVDTGDLRRKYDFSDRVSELAVSQDPFFRFVSKVAKKPTDDPQFKYTERRGSWHKRYAYPAGFSADDSTYTYIGAVSLSTIALQTADTVFYVKMAGDYKNTGNIGNIYGQTDGEVKIGSDGTEPKFFLVDQLVRIPLASAEGGTPVDYVVAKVLTVTESVGAGDKNQKDSTNEIAHTKLKLKVVKGCSAISSNAYIPRLKAPAAASNFVGVATHGLAGASVVKDNHTTGASAKSLDHAFLEDLRCYVMGTTFDKGTGYPETWKDQPFSTGYGQTQIWKTTMSMTNTDRATSLKYEGNEWARIWKEKLIEHKFDIEQSLLFGSQNSTHRTTQGAVDWVVNNGNVFSWSTSKDADGFLEDMSALLDPRYAAANATVFFCSTAVYNWLHQLGGYFSQNVNINDQFRADLAVTGRKKVLGLDMTSIMTPFGGMNVARNIHLDGTDVAILGVNLKNCAYRPLVGNGLNRDTSIYVGVQTLENSGVDRRVDQILTEAGMEWSMPESHSVWKAT
tara:strand:- start:16521 stop:18140 length:1620 start_codon:yes stop_codon:yes gene_type:complete